MKHGLLLVAALAPAAIGCKCGPPVPTLVPEKNIVTEEQHDATAPGLRTDSERRAVTAPEMDFVLELPKRWVVKESSEEDGGGATASHPSGVKCFVVSDAVSGARLDEIVVHHRPRIYGQSKYGLSRAMRVLLDLLSVKMVSSFSRSPLQYFGLLALPFLALALVFAVRTGLQVGHVGFASNWGQAALLVYILTIMAGAFFVMLGLLAELVVKVSGLHGDRVFAPLERHGRPKGGAR